MTEDDKTLREELSHDWVTNGLGQEDAPVPIYGAPIANVDLSREDMSNVVETEGMVLINTAIFTKGNLV